MNIEIGQDQAALVSATEVPAGTVGIFKKYDTPIVVVRLTTGLASLDGQYYWTEDVLKHVNIRPLPIGTVIKITV